MRRTELASAIGFCAFGLIWAALALKLPYMGEFAPGSGFLPFWFGVVLVGLSLVLILRKRPAVAEEAAETALPAGSWHKPAVVALGLALCIAAIGWLGFMAAVALYLFALLKFVEHRGWVLSLSVGLGTPLLLGLVFRTGLEVPLPVGPWGF